MKMLPIGQQVTLQYQSNEFHELASMLRQQKINHLNTMLVFTGMGSAALQTAAKRLASDLGRSLFRIDLNTVVSKYIGETEKNLERLLARAERAQSVLLFDEADSLFGKRSEIHDTHDRYANLDTNYLLEMLERYKGVVVLITDPAGKIIKRKSKGRRVLVRFPPK